MLLGILAADRIGRIKTFKLVSPLVLISVTLLAVCVTSEHMLTPTHLSVTEELQLYISRGLTDCFLLVLWVYVPEIFPTRVRNMAVGLINTTGKLGAIFGIVFVQENWCKSLDLLRGNSNPTPGSQIINAHHDRSQSEPTKWYNTEVSRVPSYPSWNPVLSDCCFI
eukprot:sb/3472456/